MLSGYSAEHKSGSGGEPAVSFSTLLKNTVSKGDVRSCPVSILVYCIITSSSCRAVVVLCVCVCRIQAMDGRVLVCGGEELVILVCSGSSDPL